MAPKKHVFPKFFPLHVNEYDSFASRRLDAGETDVYAVEYTSTSRESRGSFRPGFARFLTLFSDGLPSQGLSKLREFARNHNRNDVEDMVIWKRKITYGEWEQVEVVPGSETNPGRW
jgi:hypothetical protein